MTKAARSDDSFLTDESMRSKQFVLNEDRTILSQEEVKQVLSMAKNQIKMTNNYQSNQSHIIALRVIEVLESKDKKEKNEEALKKSTQISSKKIDAASEKS